MHSVRILKHVTIVLCVLVLLMHNSCGDFFSDLEKLDIDAKLRAIDDVISSINEDDPRPPKKKKTQEENMLGDAVEALSDMFGDECRYKCKNGNTPTVKPGHLPSSNGCGSYGIQIDVDELPGMDLCCDNHDYCYDTCNKDRTTCDKQFKTCLRNMCQKNKAFGSSNVSHKECKMAADLMYSGTAALGCDPYLKAQEKACTCSASPNSKKVNAKFSTNKKGSQRSGRANDEL